MVAKKYSILAFNLKTFLITGVLVVKNHHCGHHINKVNLRAQSLLYIYRRNVKLNKDSVQVFLCRDTCNRQWSGSIFDRSIGDSS